MANKNYLKDYFDLQERLQNSNEKPFTETGVGNLIPENEIPKEDLHLMLQSKDIKLNPNPSQPDYGYTF